MVILYKYRRWLRATLILSAFDDNILVFPDAKFPKGAKIINVAQKHSQHLFFFLHGKSKMGLNKCDFFSS